MQASQQPSASVHYPPNSFIPIQKIDSYDWTTGRLNVSSYNRLQQNSSHPSDNSTNLINHYQQQQRYFEKNMSITVLNTLLSKLLLFRFALCKFTTYYNLTL